MPRGGSRLFGAILMVLAVMSVLGAGNALAATVQIAVPATAGPQDGRADGLGSQQGTGFIDSGFTLDGTNSITVTATGTAKTGPVSPPLGPGGSGSGDCVSIYANYPCPAPSAPAFSLIAKVGDAPWQFVGSGPTTLTGTGPVLFAYNDGRYSDNVGGFTLTIEYTPSYNVCPLYDQDKIAKHGSTVPVKLQLCDENGTNLSNGSIAVHAVSLTRLSDNTVATLDDSGHANPGDNFRFDSTLDNGGGYIFNLSTKPLDPGTYALTFTASGDIYVGDTYSVQVVVH